MYLYIITGNDRKGWTVRSWRFRHGFAATVFPSEAAALATIAHW